MECIGSWCPESLNAINVTGFGIRAGVILYIPHTGQILLGVKKGKYTDFGGGCKIKQKEKPFDCARREFEEESLGVIPLDPVQNITHILITGNKAPHQIILLISVNSMENFEKNFNDKRKTVKKSELKRVEVLSFEKFSNLPRSRLSDSMLGVVRDIKKILKPMML
jgi:hypothetical protein